MMMMMMMMLMMILAGGQDPDRRPCGQRAETCHMSLGASSMGDDDKIEDGDNDGAGNDDDDDGDDDDDDACRLTRSKRKTTWATCRDGWWSEAAPTPWRWADIRRVGATPPCVGS